MPLTLDQAIAAGELIERRAFRTRATTLDRLVRIGTIVAVLPGLYVRPDRATDFHVRARAIARSDPDAALTGPAAALLHGWDSALPRVITVASIRLNRRHLASRPWLAVEHRSVPRRHTRLVDGVRITSRAMTALDLLPERREEILMTALRAGVEVDELQLALEASPGRPGNPLRSRLLAEAAEAPWSKPEWVGHEAMREAGIRGWTGNHQVRLDESRHAVLDIAFSSLELGIEIDGYQTHSDGVSFMADRRRDGDLALLRWQVVRFAAKDVLADPAAFAAKVARLAAVRARQLGRPVPRGCARPRAAPPPDPG